MSHPESPARRPVPVVGAIVGVVIAVLFGALFAWLGGMSLSAAGVIASIVLMGGWAVFGAYRYGPDTAEHADGAAG